MGINEDAWDVYLLYDPDVFAAQTNSLLKSQ
jgi:hypothetical protein